jgi:hypothetical protein
MDFALCKILLAKYQKSFPHFCGLLIDDMKYKTYFHLAAYELFKHNRFILFKLYMQEDNIAWTHSFIHHE